MMLALWKRTVLGALVALSVAGGSLTTFAAGHASAERENCYGVTSNNPCAIN